MYSCSNEDDVMADKQDPQAKNALALSSEELTSLNQGTGEELSEKQVLQVVNDFLGLISTNELNGNQAVRSSSSSSLSIKDQYYLNEKSSTRSSGSEILAPVYEVIVSNSDGTKGLAVVGADDRIPKVISYVPISKIASEEKNRSSKDISPPNEASDCMLSLAKSTYKDELVRIVSLQDKKQSTIEKIASGLNIPTSQVDESAIIEYLDLYGTTDVVNDYIEKAEMQNQEMTRSKPSNLPRRPIYSYGIPCRTDWDQHEPYNSKFPVSYIGNAWGSHAEKGLPNAGCGVIAMAQIIAALEPSTMTCFGIKMDWSYLKQNKQIVGSIYGYPFGTPDEKRKIDMVGALVYDIFLKSKSTPEYKKLYTDDYYNPIQVDAWIQTGTTSTNVVNYFQNTSGVTKLNRTANMIKWDPQIILESLMYSFPVFVGGQSHAFVIDELHCLPKSLTRQMIKQYDVYFHANFGWSDDSSGYYLVKDVQNGTIEFETTQGVYKDSNMLILTHIGKRTF